MNHASRPDRKRLYLLGTALLIGIGIYLAVPESLSYLLVGLAIVLHFGLHGAHGHGAHDPRGHGAQRPAGHGQAGAGAELGADPQRDHRHEGHGGHRCG